MKNPFTLVLVKQNWSRSIERGKKEYCTSQVCDIVSFASIWEKIPNWNSHNTFITINPLDQNESRRIKAPMGGDQFLRTEFFSPGLSSFRSSIYALLYPVILAKSNISRKPNSNHSIDVLYEYPPNKNPKDSN